MSQDFLRRKYVYVKQEAAKARLALEMACSVDINELLETVSDDEIVREMRSLEAEAIEDASRVTGQSE